jgi:hypothetical protein
MALTYDGTNGITFNDGSKIGSATSLGMRNKIINGAMVIDQRNAGATVAVTTNTYVVDRWNNMILSSATGRYTAQRSALAPSGFSNSSSVLVTTTDAAPSTLYGYALVQQIEGYNIADLGWGAAGASTVSLSFWVRSSVTGVYGVTLTNAAVTQGYTATYTINSANTWEYKTVVIPGSTSGVWSIDNSIGLGVVFGLGGGATRTAASNNTWYAPTGTYTPTQVSGGINLMATNSATFNITGVQLEKSPVATPFEYRSYGTELALCQRYLPAIVTPTGSFSDVYMGQAYSTTQSVIAIPLPVTARVAPTGLTLNVGVANWSILSSSGGGISLTALAFNRAGTNAVGLTATVASGLTGGNGTWFMCGGGCSLLFTGCEL